MDEITRHNQKMFATQLSDRLKRGVERLPANVRSAFVMHPSRTRYTSERESEAVGRTPLSRLLGAGGGRGGGTRLKLYLTLLWTAKKEPYDVRYPPATLAYLIGLPDPLGTGGRTVERNLKWLARAAFLADNPGGRRLILDDTGRGNGYVTPYQASRACKDADPERDFHYSFKVPHDFWTTGLIAELNAVEISCLLIFLDELRRRRGSASAEPIWFAEQEWKRRYGLSDDTRQRGFRGLINHGVVEQRPGHPIPSLDDPRGRQPTYVLTDSRLDGRPPRRPTTGA